MSLVFSTAAIKAQQYATDENKKFVVYKNRVRERNLPDAEINDSYEYCPLDEWNQMKGDSKYDCFEFIGEFEPKTVATAGREKQIAFATASFTENESDVMSIVALVTATGLRNLLALGRRAAAFSDEWRDRSVDEIAFELPEGVTVVALDISIGDETEVELIGVDYEIETEQLILSEGDNGWLHRNGYVAAQKLVTTKDLTVDDIWEMEANNSPDWKLGRFRVIFGSSAPYFSADFEDVDGKEETNPISLQKLQNFFDQPG